MAYLPNTSCWHVAFLILDQKWLKWRTLSHTLRSSKLTPTVVLLKSMRYVPSVERELHDKYFWKDKSPFLWSIHKAHWRRRRVFFLWRWLSCVCGLPFPYAALNLVEVHDKYFLPWIISSDSGLVAWPAWQSSHQGNLCPSHIQS